MMNNFYDHNECFYTEKPESWSSHSIIFNWLKNFPKGTKVLDIGTAKGIMGKKCRGYGFNIKGIEPVMAFAEEAKSYYDEIHCSKLENTPDLFLAKQDVIICADILEHTSEPEKQLIRLVELQKPNTQFLISVPNVAYIWIRLNLVIGKFNYVNFGILDRTHLRFFTKKTFLDLLRISRLRPLEMKYTPPPLSRVNSFFENNPIGRVIQRIFVLFAFLWPGLFAYQFVVRTEILNDEEDH
jgi:2-polyprenyl-3-methyl-5-hydroxy-6-metoxy-1,4-benzoquinol methylase